MNSSTALFMHQYSHDFRGIQDRFVHEKGIDVEGGIGWTSPHHFGINLEPVVLMCENYRSELPWQLRSIRR